ncbi:MAG: Gfo/Idh/MocA family oxidoreductase [Puniceicoccales bacterium]|jgi:predicted dehydrogenase|nr:Gfo/Idh/MocA family oxidoreductase [Puniceicoccales bacterium]
MNRRTFVQNSALLGAGLTLARPIYGAKSVIGANDKITLALVGCGSRGLGTIINCCKINKNVVVKTVCDVNKTKLAGAARSIERNFKYRPGTTTEMRSIFDDKEVDAVWVATPEHWHVLASIWALQAGKDVYVEKNPSINIFEGRKLVEAAKKYKRIVQVGFQNRSAPYAFTARDYVASGKLGKIVTVKCYNLLGGGRVKATETGKAPAWIGEDGWDLWLGPAPKREFSPSIVEERGRGGWGNYWAYSGGGLGDDASHVMDLARLVIGDPNHPQSVYCWGGNEIFGGKRETPEFQSIVYDFGTFSLSCDNAYATNYMTKTPGDVRSNKEKFPTWRNNATRTEIYGTKGLMYLGRHGGGWQVLGSGNKIVAQDGGVMPDREHQLNFIESLRTRKTPNGEVEQCHRSACLVHLGNIAYRTGNKHLLFDGAKEKFLNSDAANVLARGTYRKGFEVPEKV